MQKHQERASDNTTETEEQLINRAQDAINESRWVVGECAARWTKKYARGRTDADFGLLIGLTGDQVYQRRRVAEVFGDVKQQFTFIKWSHFYAALTWDDAQDCLRWAEEMQSTVAEMKAWRRAQRGEDLTAEPAPVDEADPNIRFVPSEPTWVQDPAEFGGRAARGESRGGEEVDTRLAGVARQFDEGAGEESYSPYRQGAGSPAPKSSGPDTAVSEPPLPSAEQLVKRMTTSLERCVKVLTPEFAKEFRRLPEPLRNRLIKVVGELSSRMGDLM